MILLASLVASKTTYEPWHVLKVNVSTPFQVQMMQQYVNMGAHQFFDSLSLKRPALVGVRDWNVEGFYKNVEEILCADVESATDSLQKWLDMEVVAAPEEAMSWTKYHNLDQIYDFMKEWARKESDMVETFSIGRSYENREILGLKIESDPSNPAVLVVGSMNGREWLTSATVTWLIQAVLSSNDPDVVAMRTATNWYFIPVLNPDGFVYSHEEDRMWGKTRKPFSQWCTGVNLERNFPFFWSTAGHSTNPCSIDYAGPNPLSEIESIHFANFVNKNAKKFVAYFNLHSTSQNVMYPFATKNVEVMPNEEEYVQVGEKMIAAMAERYNTVYGFGNVKSTIYEASGTSLDWIKGVHDIPFVWQYGLRDANMGFVVPAEEIIEISEEVFDSIFTFYKEIYPLKKQQSKPKIETKENLVHLNFYQGFLNKKN